jgi:VWFA-related protein
MLNRSALVFAPFLFAAAVAIPVSAQNAAAANPASQDQGQGTVLRANARAVVVDVVVTRGNDEPVAGLHKQDFTVMEDGKPVTVDYFEEHTARALPPGAIPPLPKMPPNVYTNVPPAPESDAVNVLLLDSLNTRKQDQSFVHKQILDFLKSMQPGTRVAIFLLGSKLRFVQGFTADTSLLLAALDDKHNSLAPQTDPSSRSREDNQADKDHIARMIDMNGGHMTGGVEAIEASQREFADFQYGDRAAMTLEALDYLARYLSGVPGRKNLIWFAGSFPVTVFPTTAQRQAMSDMRVNSSAAKRTADLLTVSKVAVYPIGAEGMMDDHPMEANNNLEQAGKGPMLLQNTMDGAADRAEKIMAMEQLASDTGGKAFYNTNDLNAAMTRAINDGSHYYTLVYTPINKKMDGKYRRIEVKAPEYKYKLAYRRGYNADDTTAEDVKPDTDPLRPLLMRGLPSASQLIYGVRVVPVSPQPPPGATRAGKNPKLAGPTTRYAIDFMVRWTDVKLNAEDDNTHTGKIQIGLMAYDRDGNAVNWVGATQGMKLTPDLYASMQKSGVPAHMEIDLPNTDVYLETGIYDWATGKAGTLEIPLHPASANTQTAKAN